MSIVIAEFTEHPSLGDLSIEMFCFCTVEGVLVPFASSCTLVVFTETYLLKLKFTPLVNFTLASSSSFSIYLRSIDQGILAASCSSSLAVCSLGVMILSASSSQVDSQASWTACGSKLLETMALKSSSFPCVNQAAGHDAKSIASVWRCVM